MSQLNLKFQMILSFHLCLMLLIDHYFLLHQKNQLNRLYLKCLIIYLLLKYLLNLKILKFRLSLKFHLCLRLHFVLSFHLLLKSHLNP